MYDTLFKRGQIIFVERIIIIAEVFNLYGICIFINTQACYFLSSFVTIFTGKYNEKP